MAYTDKGYECNSGCGFAVTLEATPMNAADRVKAATVDAHMESCEYEAARRRDMKLIHSYVMGDEGTRKQRDEVFDAVWSLQDGYGVAGFEPVQGFDWSGIRDSTPATCAAMAKEVRRIVGN